MIFGTTPDTGAVITGITGSDGGDRFATLLAGRHIRSVLPNALAAAFAAAERRPASLEIVTLNVPPFPEFRRLGRPLVPAGRKLAQPLNWIGAAAQCPRG